MDGYSEQISKCSTHIRKAIGHYTNYMTECECQSLIENSACCIGHVYRQNYLLNFVSLFSALPVGGVTVRKGGSRCDFSTM